MMFLMLLVCKVYQLRMMTAVGVALWAIMDEVTKPWMKNERHCSGKDIGWNVLGCVIGLITWMICRMIL